MPLAEACIKGHVKVAKLLLEKGAPLVTDDQRKSFKEIGERSPLVEMCMMGEGTCGRDLLRNLETFSETFVARARPN